MSVTAIVVGLIVVVAIVAIFMGRSFRGKANGQGVELKVGSDQPTPSTSRANKTRTKSRPGPA